MNKPFDPLAHVLDNELESASSELESSSKAMKNDTHGYCPKSGDKMTIVEITKGEKVFWCERTKVSSPIPLDYEE